MALQDVGVRAVIDGLASFQSGMRSMQSGVNKFASDVGAAGRGLALLGAPLVAIGIVGVKAFADFERTMTRVQAVSGATADEFIALEKVAREMGRTTIFSATESAEALAFMSQAGLSAADQIEALPKVLELAAAGMLDIAQAADIVTNVMAGAQLGVEDLGRANDVLTVAFTSANTNLQQLATAFKFAGPVASAAGVSFEETTAALALMGNAGLQASIAGTGLRGAITRLLNPTNEAAEVIKRLGVQILDTQGRLLPLSNLVGQFEQAGLSAADAMTIFGQRAGPALLTLVSQGSDALITLRDEMLDSSGTASGIAAKQMDTFTGQMAELRAAIESVSIEIGKVLVPILGDIIDAVRPVIERIANFAEANPKLTVTVIAVGAAIAALGIVLIGVGAILPGLTAAVGLLAGAFVLITGPVGLTILAIGGLVAALLIFRDQFAQVFDFIGKALELWLNNTWIPVINAIISTLNLLPKVSIPIIKKLDLELGKAFLSIADKADDAVGKIKDLATSFLGLKTATKVSQAVKDIADEFAEIGIQSGKARIEIDLLAPAVDELQSRFGGLWVSIQATVDEMQELGQATTDLLPKIRPVTFEVNEAALALQRFNAAVVLQQPGTAAFFARLTELEDITALLPGNVQAMVAAIEASRIEFARSTTEVTGFVEALDELAERGRLLQAASLGGLPFPSPQDIFESFLAAGLSEELALRARAALGGAGTPVGGGFGDLPSGFEELALLAGLSNITNTVPSEADRSSSVDSHNVTFNVDAQYVTPQEPSSIRSDLETVAQMMR